MIEQKKRFQTGYTLIEVIIVTAIIGFLIIVLMQNALQQLSKSRDAERKTDIQKIKTAFEGYYDEYQMYPTDPQILDACDQAFQHFLKEIPCDPLDNTPYIYDPYPDGSAYRILARLENKDDIIITELACDGSSGCGYPTRPDYNYGTSVGRKVSDSVNAPEGPGEPPEDPCADDPQPLRHICEEGTGGGGSCQSCGIGACPAGEIVYGCLAACEQNSACENLNR